MFFSSRYIIGCNRIQSRVNAMNIFKTVVFYNVRLKQQSNFLRKNAWYSVSAKSKGPGTSDLEPADQEDGDYQQLVNRYLRVPENGHQVLVVQPYVKWGPGKKQITTPELQLSEAVSLIGTLKKWQVIEQLTVPMKRADTNVLIGKGNLDKLKELVRANKNISAVFISVSMLKGFQKRDFEQTFRVPVFDRYSIVLQIFKEHAVTSDAKLQISLAEIPYLRSILSSTSGRHGSAGSNIAVRGSGESDIEFGRRLLEAAEGKIKNKLKKVQEQRALLNKKREKLSIPILAVVGYTNSGKTTLVKALTEKKDLQPSDKLFATLDITAHEGMLPCRLKVLYIDTVGFMSELPVPLMQCFLATLEDVMLADIILHVCDMSHPDVKAQSENVLETLKQLRVPEALINNIITIGNKCDKDVLYHLDDLTTELHRISATKLHGVDALTAAIQHRIMDVTKRRQLLLRVPSGGEEACWLYKETAVMEVWADPNNPQFSMMNVIISDAQLARFKKFFIER